MVKDLDIRTNSNVNEIDFKNKRLSLKDVINTFELVTNKKINVVWGGKSYRKREVMELWHKGEILPNWKGEITLEEGIKRYFLNGN